MMTRATDILHSRWQTLAVSSLVFTMLCAIGSGYVERRTDAIEIEVSSALDMTREEFTIEAQKQVFELGALEMQTFVETFRGRVGQPAIGSTVAVTRDQIGVIYVSRIAPLVFGLLAVELALAFIAFVYFLILLSRDKASASESILVLLRKIIPAVGLGFWLFFRSFVWIPFFGPLIALYFAPRLVIAPVILTSGETGVFQSARESMKRTSGSWLTVVLRLLGIFLACLLLLWFLLVPISIVTLFSFKIGYILWLWALFGAVAFIAACLTALAGVL